MANTDEDLERLKFEFFGIMHKLQQIKPHTVDPCAGMTQAETNALHAIGLYEQKCGAYTAHPGLIAAHMNITPSALSQILKSLEEKKFLVRNRANRDCRSVVLSLTCEGQRIFQDINARWEPRMAALIRYVGMDNLLAATNAINRVIDFDEKLRSGDADFLRSIDLVPSAYTAKNDTNREGSD